MEELLIDIGAKNKEEAERLVSLGECAYFSTKYQEFGEGKVKAKALDDRVGCALAIRLLQDTYPFPWLPPLRSKKRWACVAPAWQPIRLNPI